MRRALISSENTLLWNVIGFVVAMLVIPIVLIAKLVVMPFERPVERSAMEVLRFLRDFHDGTGDDYDWDDFTNVALADSVLEDIRLRAGSLYLPMGAEELKSLRALIAETEAVAARTRPL